MDPTQPGSRNQLHKVLMKEAAASSTEVLNEKLANPQPVESVAAPDPNQSPAQEQLAEGLRQRNSRHRWTSGRRRLEVNELPGYRLYWHKTSDVSDALQAGWEFVHKDEIQLNSFSIGGAVEANNKGTDVGSRVSVIGSPGAAELLYLMKLREEFVREDRQARMQANIAPLRAIFTGERILDPETAQLTQPGATTYVKTPYVPLFNRQPKTAPQVTGSIVR